MQQQQPSRTLWQELVSENPIYRREELRVVAPTNATDEKLLELREQRRAHLARYETLSWQRKLWNFVRPQLILFGISYFLLPFVIHWLVQSSGPIIGPMVAMMLVGTNSAAGAIVGERERRTWNALLLSGLTPVQILGGKAAYLVKLTLLAQSFLLTIGLAAVIRQLVPASLLLLLIPLLLGHSLWGVLAGLRTSLWSPSLKAAVQKSSWLGAGMGLLLCVAVLGGIVALWGLGPLWLLLVPALVFLLQLAGVRYTWRQLLKEIYLAPKDFSG